MSDQELYRAYLRLTSKLRRQGVVVRLNFEEYRKGWLNSHVLDRRGPGPDQYTLARINLDGPLQVGNVRFMTNREAIAHHAEHRWATLQEQERQRRRSQLAQFRTSIKSQRRKSLPLFRTSMLFYDSSTATFRPRPNVPLPKFPPEFALLTPLENKELYFKYSTTNQWVCVDPPCRVDLTQPHLTY